MRSLFRRHWVDLVLVGAALASVVCVVWTARAPTTAERLARDQQLLPEFRRDELRRMSWERARGRLVLERDRSTHDWWIVEPMRERASEAAVEQVLGTLESARPVRTIAREEIDRARFGLDQPHTVVRLELQSTTYRLALGGQAVAPRGSVYLELVRPDESRVFVISEPVARSLDLEPETLREPGLALYRPEQLAELWIEPGPQKLELVRRGRRWMLRRGAEQKLGNRTRVDAIFSALAQLGGDKSLDSTPEEEVAGPGERVKLTLLPSDRARPPVRLELGGRCPGSDQQIVVRRYQPDSRSACVPRSVLAVFSPTADELVHRRPFWLRPDEAEELTITSGDRRLELARKDEAFVLRAPRQATVEARAGSQRLETIMARVGTLVEGRSLADLGLEPPLGQVTVTSPAESEDQASSETLLVGRPDPAGRVHVLRQIDRAVLLVDAQTARALLPDQTLLRGLELWKLEPKEVKSLEIRGRDLAVRLLQPRPGAFELATPAGFSVDGALANDLVEALAKVTVERWVAERDDGSFGLEKPQLEVRIGIEPADAGPAERELVVGQNTSGGAFARTGSDPGVFVLSRSLLQRLRTLPLDRSAFLIDLERATGITLAGQGGRVELARVGATFEVVGATVELGPGRVAELTEALGSLRPEAALHTGPPRPEEGLARPALVLEAHYPAGSAPWLRRILFGAVDSWQDSSVRYARVDGVDATFVILKSKLEPLFSVF